MTYFVCRRRRKSVSGSRGNGTYVCVSTGETIQNITTRTTKTRSAAINSPRLIVHRHPSSTPCSRRIRRLAEDGFSIQKLLENNTLLFLSKLVIDCELLNDYQFAIAKQLMTFRQDRTHTAAATTRVRERFVDHDGNVEVGPITTCGQQAKND